MPSNASRQLRRTTKNSLTLPSPPSQVRTSRTAPCGDAHGNVYIARPRQGGRVGRQARRRERPVGWPGGTAPAPVGRDILYSVRGPLLSLAHAAIARVPVASVRSTSRGCTAAGADGHSCHTPRHDRSPQLAPLLLATPHKPNSAACPSFAHDGHCLPLVCSGSPSFRQRTVRRKARNLRKFPGGRNNCLTCVCSRGRVGAAKPLRGRGLRRWVAMGRIALTNPLRPGRARCRRSCGCPARWLHPWRCRRSSGRAAAH